ncbi:MAG TPA: glycoside hydrolase family 2 TIM barrel-domain containing protein [Spirochaetota bacterium]|nr:glycoside hydrolase family 2 TIM barrel-domain containing protein [Spirochaetota bacterium]
MDIVIIILLIPLAIISAGALFVLYLLFLYPREILRHPIPVIGAGDDGFEIREIKGIPYILSGGLPYPTHFEQSSHRIFDLNGVWQMRFDPKDLGESAGWPILTLPDDGWNPVKIPSTFNNAAGGHTSYEGPVWFHRRFRTGTVKTAGLIARLRFDGVLLRSTVWLNGTKLGIREGGYTPFFFDVSGILNYKGDNHLVVKTDNRLTWTSLPPKIWKHHHAGWHTYGGIYRGVRIELLPDQYIFKAAAESQISGKFANLRLDVLVHTAGERHALSLTCSVYGPDGRRIGIRKKGPVEPKDAISAHRFAFRVDRPSLWSPEHPCLYTVRLSLRRKGARQDLAFKTGIRRISVAGTSIELNGSPVFLKGICKHEDDPLLGATQNAAVIARDLAIVKKLNANYIRMAHYPHCVEELIAARDAGLLLGEEIANYQTGTGFAAWHEEKQGILRFPVRMFGMRQMMNRTLLLNAQREIAEMIERDRNNPAIIIWSVGNETYTLFKNGEKVYAWLRDVVRALDTTRPVTMAELTYNISFFDTNRRAAASMDVISVNMYCGWYYGGTADIGPHLDRLHRSFPGKPVIISEFGADAAPGRKEEDGIWKAERVGFGKTYSEEYQAMVIREYWNAARSRPFVAGISPWVFSDFYCTWFPNNPVPFYNLKGITSARRVPKAAFHLLRKLYGER